MPAIGGTVLEYDDDELGLDMEIDSDLTDTGLGTDSICSSASTTFNTGLEEEGTNPSFEGVGNSSKRKRKNIIKTEDDHIPLPNPFPLPKHYQANVKAGLRNTEMTSEASKSFLSSVASAMLAYKRYPTNEDDINVGTSVIQQYDFIAQPTGAPYVSMFLLLKIMLYNFFSLGWYCTVINESL